ncbi:MAG: endonuclease domain-containing protein [Hyphomicrobium sp.]
MANERARELRKTMSTPERKLWRALSNRQAGDLRFRRQHPIGPYVVDFVCLERRLVIEVDGGQHGEAAQMAHDVRRSAWLQSEGFAVLRFWSNDVMRDCDGVVEAILRAASPPSQGEGRA